MEGKKRIVTVRPSPLASVIGILGGAVFLIIGILIMSAGSTETGGGGLVNAFIAGWVLVCIGIIAYYTRNLAAFSGEERERIPPTAADVVEIEPLEPAQPPAGDFASRLRKLDALRRDDLIDDEEFRRKRSEILEEKW